MSESTPGSQARMAPAVDGGGPFLPQQAGDGFSPDRVMRLVPTSELDLLRMAIIRCDAILRAPQVIDPEPFLLQLGSGIPPLRVQDPAAIRFLHLMRHEQIDVSFSVEAQADGRHLLQLGLSQNWTRVSVPVAVSGWINVTPAERVLAFHLTLRGILAGFSKALARVRKGSGPQREPLSPEQSREWAMSRASGI